MSSPVPLASAPPRVSRLFEAPAHLLAIGLLAVLLIWYGSTAMEMVSLWESSTSASHGFLAVLLVAGLLWRNRLRISAQPVEPSPWGLGLLAGAGALWYAGYVAGVAIAQHVALVSMIWGLLWCVLGDKVFRAMLGPLSFLVFAIPFGPSLVPLLMDWTATSVVFGLRLSGIPVLQEGTNFIIPSGHWSVIEWCSGIRYLSVSTFAGTVFAYLNFRSWKKRTVLVGLSILLPIAANWVRAYTIVMVAHLSDNKYGVVVGHLTLGWIIFGVAVFAIFSLGARWRDPPVPFDAAPSPPPGDSTLRRVALYGAAAILIAAPWRIPAGTEPVAGSASLSRQEFLSFLDGCSREEGRVPVPQGYLDADQRVEGRYRCEGRDVGVFAAWYRGQKQGHELIASANQKLLGAGWWVKKPVRLTQSLGGVPVEVLEQEYKRGTSRIVVRRLYWVAGWTTTSEIMAKAMLGAARVLGRGGESAVILWMQSFETSLDGSLSAQLDDFGQRRASRFVGTLGKARVGPP